MTEYLTAPTGTAQVCEIPVREKLTGPTEAFVLRFDPVVSDERYPPKLHEFGIGVTTNGVSDVFAMDPRRPGYCLPNESGAGWLSLLNCVSIDGPWTLDSFLVVCGYEVVR